MIKDTIQFNSREKDRKSRGEIEKEILLIIAKEGEKSPYELTKHSDSLYGPIFIAVQRLVRRGNLILSSKKSSAKGGKATYYKITFGGILKTWLLKKDLTLMDEVFERWKEYDPLIFGNWQYLRSKIPKEEVAKLLDHLAPQFADRPWRDKKNKIIFPVEAVRGMFRSEFFSYIIHHSLFPFDTVWGPVIQGNKELKKYAIQHLTSIIERYEVCLRRLKKG